MSTSIIIPCFNGWELTNECLRSIARTTRWGQGGGIEVVIVDNGSSDATINVNADLVIHNWRNRGFAVACNQGAKLASGEVLVFLNNDTVCHPGWYEVLIDHLVPLTLVGGKCIGITGPMLLNQDNSIQHTGIVLMTVGGVLTAVNRVDEHKAEQVEAVSGACLAIGANLFRELDGFDEEYYNGYEDVDLCLRARKEGYSCWYEPTSVITHYGAASGPERWAKVHENIALLNERWATAGKRSSAFPE